MADETSEFEVASGDKRIKIRGSDTLTAVIGILTLAGLVWIGTFLHAHAESSKLASAASAQATTDAAAVMLAAVREWTAASKESVYEQRVMNCIIALPQEKREREADFCKRVVR